MGEAENLYLRAIEKFPEEPGTYELMASNLKRQGRTEEAQVYTDRYNETRSRRRGGGTIIGSETSGGGWSGSDSSTGGSPGDGGGGSSQPPANPDGGAVSPNSP